MQAITQIRDYLQTLLNKNVYTYRRPALDESITVKPVSSAPVKPAIWLQELVFSVEVVNKEQPKKSFDLLVAIRNDLAQKKGKLVTNGIQFLIFVPQSTIPTITDLTLEGNEVYSLNFLTKYLDVSLTT